MAALGVDMKIIQILNQNIMSSLFIECDPIPLNRCSGIANFPLPHSAICLQDKICSLWRSLVWDIFCLIYFVFGIKYVRHILYQIHIWYKICIKYVSQFDLLYSHRFVASTLPFYLCRSLHCSLNLNICPSLSFLHTLPSFARRWWGVHSQHLAEA